MYIYLVAENAGFNNATSEKIHLILILAAKLFCKIST